VGRTLPPALLLALAACLAGCGRRPASAHLAHDAEALPPAAVAANVTVPDPQFYPVYRGTSACVVVERAHGAVLACSSVIAVVDGDAVRQAPEWLEGLPEYIDWDGGITSMMIVGSDPGTPELPAGLHAIVSAGNRHGPGAELRWDGRRWTTFASRPGDPWSVFPVSGPLDSTIVTTTDGATWRVDPVDGPRPRVVRQSADGVSTAFDLPRGGTPTALQAAGDRVWVTVDMDDIHLVLSSSPVQSPILEPSVSVPVPHEQLEGKMSGLDLMTVDVPFVSSAPPGPGTSACTRPPVVYLGTADTPALRQAVARVAPGLPLLHAAGRAPGHVVFEGDDPNVLVAPSSGTRDVLALAPPSFDEAERIAGALVEDEGAAQVRVLCAAPRVTRTETP
jgi:hypothetical protein